MRFEDFSLSIDRALGLTQIDEILRLVNRATKRQLQSLDDQAKGLSPDQFEDPSDMDGYRDHLSEQAIEAESVRELVDELSILALMKKVELRLNSVLGDKVQGYAPSKDKTKKTKRIGFNDYRTVLGDPVYDSLKGKEAFRELLQICNSIKHNGVVDKSLADPFPSWIEGTELKGLNEAYLRLRGEMVEFVYEYVTAIYSAYPRPKRGWISP